MKEPKLSFIRPIWSFFNAASLAAELSLNFRELSSLYKAGIPFVPALNTLARQTSHPWMKEALSGCLQGIHKGHTFAWAMARYPHIFPGLYIKMTEIGERSGKLHVMFDRIATHAEKRQDMIMKLRSALIYPSLVLLFSFILLIIGPAWLFRGIFDFLLSLDIPLPMTTRVLISVSSAMRSPFFLISLLPAALILIMVGKSLWQKDSSRELILRIIYQIPGAGRVLKTSEIAAFTRTLALVIDAGLPLLQGMTLAYGSLGSTAHRRVVEEAIEKISDGESLRSALQETGLFPPTVIHLLEAGEASGKVTLMLEKASLICEQNLDQSIETAVSLVQPFVMLVIGIIVGFVIIATMTPMVKIIEGLV